MTNHSEKKIVVLYHANCLDGLGAAYAAWLRYGEAADYLPVAYGEAPPDVTGKKVFILDFSYKRDVLLAMQAKAQRLVVIDHHKTAMDDLGDLDFANFDMARSGCVLAWDYFHKPFARPPGLELIQDQDLWQHAFEETKPYCAALRGLVSTDFASFSQALTEEGVAALVERGRDLLAVFDADVTRLLKRKHQLVLNGIGGLACNANAKYASELGNLLATESGTFGAVYSYDGLADEWCFSLRSIGDFDVSAIAKLYGGGGHKNACGFAVKRILGDE